jgi:hypothetical protein
VKIAEIERNLWDRQPDESSGAFAAWVVYRDMVPDRKQSRVARELKKSGQLISKWSAKNQWARRVEAWEIYLDQRRREETVLEVIEARKRQLQIGKLLLSKGLEALLALKPTIARKNAAGEVEHILCIKPGDLVKLLEAGARFVKVALGEVDEDKPTKFELIFEERNDDEEPPQVN